MVPPGVLAPYERAQGQARRVRSQAERDLDAIALARRKGIMLAQLDALAGDDRLDAGSGPVIEWFAAGVRAATSPGRLDELAALLPQAGIRRRRWWQGQPAIETADYGDDEDDQDEDDDGDQDEDDGDDDECSPVTGAAMALAGGYAPELAARNYQLSPSALPGCCQIVAMTPHGRADAPPEACPAPAGHLFGPVPVCDRHYQALTVPGIREWLAARGVVLDHQAHQLGRCAIMDTGTGAYAPCPRAPGRSWNAEHLRQAARGSVRVCALHFGALQGAQW